MVNSSGIGSRCPECGRDAQDRSVPPPPSFFHWRWFLWLLIPIVVIACAIWLKRGESTVRMGSGTMFPKFVMPGVSFDRLRAIADGRESFDLADGLLDAVAPKTIFDAPGRSRLDVGFVNPRHRRTEFVRIGWPTTWYSRSESRVYADAIAATEFAPAATDPALPPLGRNQLPRDPLRIPPRDPWTIVDYTTLLMQPSPESSGGAFVTTRVSFLGIVASFGFVVLAWCAAGLGIWLTNCFRSPSERTYGLRCRAIVALLALMAILLVSYIDMDRSTRIAAPVQARHMMVPGSTVTGDQRANTLFDGFVVPEGDLVARHDLHRAVGDAQANARLARRILEPVQESGRRVDSDEYLAAVFRDEAVSTSQTTMWRDDPVFMMFSETEYQRHGGFDDAGPLAHPPGLALSRHDEWLTLRWVPHDPEKPTQHWRVNLELLGCAVVGLGLLAILLRFVTFALPAAAVRSRVLRGRCGGCGHIVIAPTKADESSPKS